MKTSSGFSHQKLIDTRSLTKDEIQIVFSQADQNKETLSKFGMFIDPKTPISGTKVIGLLFFEPSTRTRLSFQMASYRLGFQALVLENAQSSSLAKGESITDTILNIVAMGPDALVVRYGVAPEVDELLPSLSLPVINAGSGVHSHPTQALLDAYTMKCEFGSTEGLRVLIVGDLRHSRVAHSNFDVLEKLGVEVGVCGPEGMMPDFAEFPNLTFFEDLEEGIRWADIYMGLRVQVERHQSMMPSFSMDSYHAQFGLTLKRLQLLRNKSKAVIMHPGPVLRGFEFADEVMQDLNCRVLDQVSNGVLIRGALLSLMLSKND